MRNLTQNECLAISGADDRNGTLTVSPETIGSAIGGGIGSAVGNVPGAIVGGIVGGAVGNYVSGDRTPGSVGSSGIPWGASNGGGSMWGSNNSVNTSN